MIPFFFPLPFCPPLPPLPPPLTPAPFLPSSLFPHALCSQHIAHAAELLIESLSQLSALLSDLGPFLRSPQDASNSVLLQEVGPLSNLSQAIKCPGKTPILHKLVAVNAFIQLFVNLSRSCQAGYNVRKRGPLSSSPLIVFNCCVFSLISPSLS